MDTRFVQAHKEARWALGLTLLYLAVWLVAAYLSGVAPGFTGFPRWFEMACSNSTAGRLSGGGVRYLGLCDA